jgi:hypothetical protein
MKNVQPDYDGGGIDFQSLTGSNVSQKEKPERDINKDLANFVGNRVYDIAICHMPHGLAQVACYATYLLTLKVGGEFMGSKGQKRELKERTTQTPNVSLTTTIEQFNTTCSTL